MTRSSTCSLKQQVALFGGAFDPFHNGHLAVIRQLLAQPNIDTVLVVPSADRPDKPELSPARDRLEMTKLSIAAHFGGDPRVEVSDLQSRAAVGYATIDLVAHFERDPQRQVKIVIGQELLPDLAKWREAESLKQRAEFLVIRRPGAVEQSAPTGWRVSYLSPFQDSGVEISSSELREKMRRGESVDSWLPHEVLSYCHAKQLYR